MNLFYLPSIQSDDSQVAFDKDESRHIGKVLRKQEGDVLHITNGLGSFFEVQLISVNPKQCLAQVLSEEKIKPLPYRLHLAVAPTKLNDRFEWFLEKATEIGVDEITPLLCDHSERKVIKPERYQKIIVSAMKQSIKAHLPILNETASFSKFISTIDGQSTFIAHCDEGDKQTMKQTIQPQTDVTILIGPEGDFSKDEIKLAMSAGIMPISLGTSRLRTETAAIVACHSVAFINL